MSVGGVESVWVEGRHSGGGSSWTTNDSARLDSTSCSIIAPTTSSSPPVGSSSMNGEDTGPIMWIEQPQPPQRSPPDAEGGSVTTVTVNIEGVVVMSGGGAEQSENATASAQTVQLCGESGGGEAATHSSVHLVVDRPPSYPDTKEWAANSEYAESSRADEEEEEDMLTPHTDRHQRLAAADPSIDPALATIVAAAVKVSKEAEEGRLEQQQHQGRETDEAASPQKKPETEVTAPLHANGSGGTWGIIEVPTAMVVGGQRSGREEPSSEQQMSPQMMEKTPNGGLTIFASVNNAYSQNPPVKTESEAVGSAGPMKAEDTLHPVQPRVGDAEVEGPAVSEQPPENKLTVNFFSSSSQSRPEAVGEESDKVDASLKPVEQNPLSDVPLHQAQSAEIRAETADSLANSAPTQPGSASAGLEGGAPTLDVVAENTTSALVETVTNGLAHTGVADPLTGASPASLCTDHVPAVEEKAKRSASIDTPGEDAVTVVSNAVLESTRPPNSDVNGVKTAPRDSSFVDFVKELADVILPMSRIPVDPLEVVTSEVPLSKPAEASTNVGVDSADSSTAEVASNYSSEIIFIEQPPVVEQQQPLLRDQVAESVKPEALLSSATETVRAASSGKEGATQPTDVNKADGQAESAPLGVFVEQPTAAGEHRIPALDAVRFDDSLPTLNLLDSSNTAENAWKPASDEPATETRPTDYSQIVFIEQPANEQRQPTADRTLTDISASVGGSSDPMRKDDGAAEAKPLTAINLDALNQSYLESLERQRSANDPTPSNVAEVVCGQATGSVGEASCGSAAERLVADSYSSFDSGSEKPTNSNITTSVRPSVNGQPASASHSATPGDASGGTQSSGNAEPANFEHRVRFQVLEPTQTSTVDGVKSSDNYDKLLDDYGQKVRLNTQESLALVDRLGGGVLPNTGPSKANGQPLKANGRTPIVTANGAALGERDEIPYFAPPPLKQPPPVDASNLLTTSSSTDESVDVECINVNANLLRDPTDCVMMSNGRVAILDAELGLLVVSVADRSVMKSADAPQSATTRWRNPMCAAYALDSDHLLVLTECCSVQAAPAEQSQAENALSSPQQNSVNDRPFRHHPPTIADVPTLNQLLEPRDTDYRLYICRFDARTLRLESRVEAPKFLANKVVNGYRLCYSPSTHAIYLAANAAREDAYIYELNTDCRWVEMYNRRGRLFTDLQWFAVIGPVTELLVLEANRQHVLLLSVYDGDVVGQRMVAIAAQPNALAVDEAGALFAFDRATARVAQHSRLHFDRIRNVTLMDRAHCRLSAHGGFLAVLTRGVKQLKLYKY